MADATEPMDASDMTDRESSRRNDSRPSLGVAARTSDTLFTAPCPPRWRDSPTSLP